MTKDRIENRKNARAYFSEKEGIEAVLLMKKPDSTEITVSILNISAGGVGLMMRRDDKALISPRDRLDVKSIKGPNPLSEISDVTIEVMYILDFQKGVGVYMGCKFSDLPKDLSKKLDQFVHRKLQTLDGDSFQIY